MSISQSRRPPIPSVFKSDPLASGNRHKQPKDVGDHNDPQPLNSVISPPAADVPSPPSAHRHFILPAPSERNVKYVPFTRGSKPKYSKTFAAPDNQNIPVFQTPTSPAQFSEASDESTLVAPSPLSARLGLKILKLSKSDSPSKFRNEVLVEKTNLTSGSPTHENVIVQETLNEAPTPSSPSLDADEKVEAEEEHVLSAVSDSTEGMMSLNSETAHLDTAASIRSIRSTLDQLRKKRSVSRSRVSQSRVSLESVFSELSGTTSFDNEPTVTKTPEDPQAAPLTRTETISDLVSQILSIIRPRHCPDHAIFMAKWGAIEYKTYNQRWAKLLKSAPPPRFTRLRFIDIPWPVFPAIIAITPIPSLITRENLSRFLICSHCDDRESSLKKLSDEIDRWNNFQVMDSIIRRVREVDQKKVEEAWSRVVMVLMEIRGDHSSNIRIVVVIPPVINDLRNMYSG